MAAARAEAAVAAAVPALCPAPAMGSHAMGSQIMGSHAPGRISAPLAPRFTFENFVVGKPNALAYSAARSVAEAQTPQFNPLFLFGRSAEPLVGKAGVRSGN